MASVKQIQVTFDCAEPERVARFWCRVLGCTSYRRHRKGLLLGTISIARLKAEQRVRRSHTLIPRVWAATVLPARSRENSKVVKNRLHLEERAGRHRARG